MPPERVIIHVDMDAFFAAVEQRDEPAYRGKPVVVGSDPKGGKGRGVVSTCSYEARKFGIHSAQPISEAWRRCPHAVFLPVRGQAYSAASKLVFEVFEEFTPQIEPISIDEAFLDVTNSLHLFGTKREVAGKIQRRIFERTELTASLGVAPNKMLAKIASDLNKPRGIVIVEPGAEETFLRPLPVSKLWGVGRKTQDALSSLGIRTIGDLADFDRDHLVRRFGAHGEHLWELAHGRDDRPVETEEEVKSIGHEHTYETDTDDQGLVASTLMQLCEGIAHRMWKQGVQGRIVTTKIRFEDFTTLTRRKTLNKPVLAAAEVYAAAQENLARGDVAGRKLRLIGVSVSGLTERVRLRQQSMFDEVDEAREEKRRKLADTIARIRQKHGPGAIRQGRSLDKPEDT